MCKDVAKRVSQETFLLSVSKYTTSVCCLIELGREIGSRYPHAARVDARARRNLHGAREREAVDQEPRRLLLVRAAEVDRGLLPERTHEALYERVIVHR